MRLVILDGGPGLSQEDFRGGCSDELSPEQLCIKPVSGCGEHRFCGWVFKLCGSCVAPPVPDAVNIAAGKRATGGDVQ